MLEQKNILLCVTGGIAVYKAAALTSQLVQAGANVKVVMTEAACQFVTPLTFQALSKNEVYVDTFDEKKPHVIAHIDLADWAHVVLVAPATANTIAKLAHGLADNMVTTILLATKAPVWIAPAMNVHMYEHPAVQQNMRTLQSFGYRFIEPAEGMLACGYVGKGRLEEPETIVTLLEQHFSTNHILKGKKVLVTAGPTREKLDPVRFFSNHSTGKMGYALAEAARDFGADVVLISGPTALPSPPGVQMIRVESAQHMYEEVMNHFHDSDIVIKTAAVADYRPKYVADNKIKKQQGDYTVVLERTIDILQTLGEQKTHQFLVGFAAETNDVERYAKDKLTRKNADMIVANNVVQEGAGFGTDTNIVTLFKRDGTMKKLPLLPKSEVAKEILREVHREIEGRV
ncbi:bifunctional phosphopantothenoylcysteine decarboxylase/phosphopantothenate--cysteine ligase CoaBC [Anoxybacillus sp. LAT_38]|uniref:bifunctional phosphopantothenoylcysteine decarboxylase/phosphopantothenate--cysteine ligase CoaBC n=1 Tax=Anoxybacillus sp. LAT_26 TaxID=2862719 RepID=UPI001EEA77AE|nr:bifunctional phosphopantothenoylcysteine decarboxylase/phosphopantothenate--cysteine ligase CoaBC [Anoxybacillus sp. LAT_26]MCG6185726.1 bifunctional phosphopantothenoylcysteine decarboxylase/phosphopantothenate--cysteine ligase CoaBC [Anoxybacillus sp. LAT_26]MCG6195859.1 bifunctional phosphopantothenoylcysteine decarboxylase/phosphopantothenate--cysteine ligase CoaBC [Anoxybacillus sp. LAT_38]